MTGKDGLPQSRPVCASKNSMNLHLNNLVSEVLEPLGNSCGGMEVCSSEEMLSDIDRLNLKLLDMSKSKDENIRRKACNLLLLGADAVAMYPNFRKGQTIEVVCEEYRKSDIRINMDWREVAKYVVLNMTRREQKKYKV